MTLRLLAAVAVTTLVLATDVRAIAQTVIIVPNNPLKERDEYFSRVVNEWWQSYLGRKPNDKEHAQMMQKLRTGTNAIAAQAILISGDEYYKNHGSSTQGFIQGVFKDVVGRKATVAEVAMLQAQVNGFGRYKFAVDLLIRAQTP